MGPGGWGVQGRRGSCGLKVDRVGADITVLRQREVDYDSDTPRKITGGAARRAL